MQKLKEKLDFTLIEAESLSLAENCTLMPKTNLELNLELNVESN